MRRAARIDSTHTEIVKALRQIGASVQSIATVGKGCPDLLVWFRGTHYLMELKTGNGKLTPSEYIWHQSWGGEILIVRNVDEALRAVGAA